MDRERLIMTGSLNLNIAKSFSCDVIVIGGGTTGIAAAIAAAREGAQTLLVEQNGYVGGNAIDIPSWMGFHSREGDEVVRGIALTLQKRMAAKGAASRIYPDPICGSVSYMNGDWLKIIAAQMLQEHGVQMLLHTRFAGLEKENDKIARAFLLGGEGVIAVDCKFAIDCTDSGLVAREAGEVLKKGRENDGKVQVSSWVFEVGEIDFTELGKYFLANPTELRPFALDDPLSHVNAVLKQEGFIAGAFTQLIKKAKNEGMNLPRDNMPGVFMPNQRKFVTVAGRVEDVNPADSVNYTGSEMQGFSQVEPWLQFLKNHVPGFSSCVLSSTCASIGIREMNHLVGEYTLCADDLLEGRVFDDAIACGAYHLDIHSPDHGGLETRHPKVYTIPYRSLKPRKTTNLLVAGRAISATHEAMASTRVIPIGMAQAEAAGVAAAMQVDRNHSAEFTVENLRKKLTDRGALCTAKCQLCRA